MTFILMGFGTGLCWEEVPLVLLEGMEHLWDKTKKAEGPNIMLTLHGGFKGETGFKWHCLPLVDHTLSGIPHRPC